MLQSAKGNYKCRDLFTPLDHFNGGQIEIRASNPVVLRPGLETSLSGGHRRGATPVPIPNTEVKPSTGDGTNGAIRWESSKLPGFIMKRAVPA